MRRASSRFAQLVILAIGLLALNAVAIPDRAIAAEPIKIGFSMALTGAYAGNGKAALLATQMWADDQNAKGGLLDRPVQLIDYDDQSNPSLVPGIYTKLFDIDKVDLVISGYGTNIIGPAMPLVMQHNKVFMSLAGLRVNEQFHYNKYFQIFPFGPKADITFAQGFFDVAGFGRHRVAQILQHVGDHHPDHDLVLDQEYRPARRPHCTHSASPCPSPTSSANSTQGSMST